MKIAPLEGGKEARARASDLSRMLLRLAEKKGWSAELLDSEGFALLLGGEGVERVEHEAGGHRFMGDDPATGKRHTSFCSISVSRLAPSEQARIALSDIEFSFQKASGPGGQHVNKTESAVRAKHTPTGLSVLVQSGRCQHENKRLAMRLLEQKVSSQAQASERERQKESRAKRETVGFGNANRTYRLREDQCHDAASGARAGARKTLNGHCDALWPEEGKKA